MSCCAGRAGAKGIFQDNVAIGGGGDICAGGNSSIDVSHADMRGSSAKQYGGAILAVDNATVVMHDTKIVNATATGNSGGAISLGGNATLTAINCLVQNCSAQYGGGMELSESSTLLLVNARIFGNTARARAHDGVGGCVKAVDTSAVTLQNVTAEGNTADSGGCLALYDDASLDIVGVSHIRRNRATGCGGGALILSDQFSVADVMGGEAPPLLAFADNKASTHADVCLATSNLTFVGSNSNLDEFVASLDSQGGMLHALLNMTGPHGLPTDERLSLSIYNQQNVSITTGQPIEAKPARPPHEGLKEVYVKVVLRPGEWMALSVPVRLAVCISLAYLLAYLPRARVWETC